MAFCPRCFFSGFLIGITFCILMWWKGIHYIKNKLKGVVKKWD